MNRCERFSKNGMFAIISWSAGPPHSKEVLDLVIRGDLTIDGIYDRLTDQGVCGRRLRDKISEALDWLKDRGLIDSYPVYHTVGRIDYQDVPSTHD